MNSFQFLINNQEVDIIQRQDFSYKIFQKYIDFNNLQQRSGAHTLNIKLPRTKQNEIIFGQLFNLDSRDKFFSELEFTAKLIKNSVEILEGIFYITSINFDFLEGYIISENISWVDELKGKKLNEIQTLTKYNFKGWDDILDINDFATNLTIDSEWIHSDYFDIIFPFIGYGNFFIPNKNIPGLEVSRTTYSTKNNSENAHFTFDTFPPAVYVIAILRSIFEEIGWTIDAQIFRDPQFKRLIIPNTTNNEGYPWRVIAEAIIDSTSSTTLDYNNLDTPTIGVINHDFTKDLETVIPGIFPISDLDFFASFTRPRLERPVDNDIKSNHSFSLYYNKGQFSDEFDYFVYFAPVKGQYTVDGFVTIEDLHNTAFSTYPADVLLNLSRFGIACKKIQVGNLSDIDIYFDEYNYIKTGVINPTEDLVGFSLFNSVNPQNQAHSTFIMPLFSVYPAGSVINLDKGDMLLFYFMNPILIDTSPPFIAHLGQKWKVKNLKVNIKNLDSRDQLEPALFLPNISQSDFVKEIITLFNLYPISNNKEKKIVFERFNDLFLYDNQLSLDFTDKCSVKRSSILPANIPTEFNFDFTIDSKDHYVNFELDTELNYNKKISNLVYNQKDSKTIQSKFAVTENADFRLVRDQNNNFNTPSYISDSIINAPFFTDEKGFNKSQSDLNTSIEFEFQMRILKVENQQFIFDQSNNNISFPVRVFRPLAATKDIYIQVNRYVKSRFTDTRPYPVFRPKVWDLSWNQRESGLFDLNYNKMIEYILRSHLLEIDIFIDQVDFNKLSFNTSVKIKDQYYFIQEVKGFDAILDRITRFILLRQL